MSIREAFFSGAEVVPAAWDAFGRVLADTLSADPPGIPNSCQERSSPQRRSSPCKQRSVCLSDMYELA